VNKYGKREKLGINFDLFCRLGAILRYAKSQCKNKNSVYYTGFASVSGEFEPTAENTYNIPDKDGNILGTVTLRLGDITGVSLNTPYFDIAMSQDEGETVPVFPKVENSTPKVIQFTEEFLGFKPADSVVESGFTAYGMYNSLAEVMQAHPEKELDWLLNKKYEIVTEETLPQVMDYFNSFSETEHFYCDTETTGLNINFKSRVGQADQCVGIILSVEDGVSYYFPMQMKKIPNLCGGDHFYFMEHYMKPLLESRQLVGHNSAFDWKVCHIYGINANFTEDTMALIALTFGAEKENYPLSLKENGKILLGHDSLELSDLVTDNSWGESDVKFWDLPAELVRYYACADTDNTRGIFKYAEANDLLQKYNATRIYRIEDTFSLAGASQEFYGHRVAIT
jgi:DNA polymerase-1